MFQDFHVDDINDNCGLVETDIFSIPPTCKEIEETEFVQVPMNPSATSPSCDQPLEFAYKGTPAVYLKLNDSYVYLTCKVEHTDGTPLEEDEDVGPVNYLGNF